MIFLSYFSAVKNDPTFYALFIINAQVKNMACTIFFIKIKNHGVITGQEGKTQRVASIDAYRGFVMLLMMAEILELPALSKNYPNSSVLQILSAIQTHMPWVGIGVHDMIQPSFTFLVGVALPFSISSRQRKGATIKDLLKHGIKRAIILISLGILLRYFYNNMVFFTFEDTLTQIGLGYAFLVILACKSRRFQLTILFLLLFGYWAFFAAYPVPKTKIDFITAGANANWIYNCKGFAAHWNKDTNIAAAFDRWFLNLFPQKRTFLNNPEGYVTLSFIPTLATMILGLNAGNKLMTSDGPLKKMFSFCITGFALIVLGLALHFTGINPIIKRIWTPAWTSASGGICFLILAVFYAVIDVGKRKRWSSFLTITGVNSLAAYFLSAAGRETLIQLFYFCGHFGVGLFINNTYLVVFVRGCSLLLEWIILRWMYRKQLFLKV